MSKEGEVERKVRELGDEVFQKYNPGVDINGEDVVISKEDLRLFIKSIMEEAGEGEAWDDNDFEEGYNQFD